MPALPIAIATRPLNLPIRQALDAIAGSGCQGVQLELQQEIREQELGETGRRQLLHYLEERNLKVGPATFSLRRPLLEPVGLDGRIDAIRKAMAFAWKLGANVLTMSLGELPAAESPAAETARQVLEDLAAYANQVGVIPTLIVGNASATRLLEILKSITCGPLALDVDPASLTVGRQSPTDWMRELHPYLQHVQLRDAVREPGGIGREVALGAGEVDWQEFAAALQEIDYRHWLSIIRASGTSPLDESLAGLKFIRRLLLQSH